MPEFAVNVPPVPENTLVVAAVKLMVLVPPSSVPFVLVQVPLKECVFPVPRFSVPPKPLRVSPPPDTLPVKVATPAVFVIETRPVVVNPAILWATTVPAMTIGEDVEVKIPRFTKLSPNVVEKLPVFKDALALIVTGALITLAALKVTAALVLAIINPAADPDAGNVAGNSVPVV